MRFLQKKNDILFHTRRVKWLRVLFVLLIIGTSTHIAHATLQDDLEKVQRELKEQEQLKAVTEKKRALIEQQIATITAEASTLEGKIATTKQTITKKEDAIDRLRNGISEQERTIVAQRAILGNMLRTQYMAKIGGASFLMPSATDADYLSQTQDAVHDTISRMTQLRDKLAEDHHRLEDEKQTLVSEQQKLAQRSDYLESAQSYKETLAMRAQKDIAAYENKIDDLEEKEADIRHEIEQIEASKLDGTDLGDLPSSSKAGFIYPVRKPFILTQGYGKTKFASKAAYANNFHNGVDFASNESFTIIAPADGKVIATGNMGRYGYGQWIAIDHGNKLVTLYGHLSKIRVSRGDKVDQGDSIGTMGSTGYSTGRHLHFTVFAASSFEVIASQKVDGLKVPTGASVNPMKYL